MLKKILIYTFILLFNFGCDYKPLYQNKTKDNFNILFNDSEGNNQINSMIQSYLKRYNNNNSSKIFNIKLNSSYEKIIVAKDAAGNATNYQIVITSNFYIKNKTIDKSLTIVEKFNFNEGTNTFENNDYERVIKNNMVSSIVNKLLLDLRKIR